MKLINFLRIPGISSLVCISLIMNRPELFANDKFKPGDFGIALEQITSGPGHIWINSGHTTVNPENLTVMGVNEFYSPPFAAKSFSLKINIMIDSLSVSDRGSYGKGDVGLLFSGGTWFPHKIVRKGTYHHLKNGQLISLGVTSELIPLFDKSGFIEKVCITNRTERSLSIALSADIQPGIPSFIPLDSWGYGVPRANASKTKQITANSWTTDLVKISFYEENTSTTLLPGKTSTAYFTVVINNTTEKIPDKIQVKELENNSINAWEKRIEKFTKNIPSIESNIEGLNDYYKRSILSGLVSIWENVAYTPNPFLAESGIDGGGICTYPWGLAYHTQIATMMLDSAIIDIAKNMVNIDLEKYYAFTLNGTGAGVKYSYSPWSYTKLVSTIFKFLGPEQELLSAAKTIILNNEKQQSENNLIDYGVQNNLLEMRGAGWEHFVSSPNAERSWCLSQLAEMGKLLNHDPAELNNYNKQAKVITKAIQKELWDNKVKWFASIYPDGFKDFVYSIQVYDALRAGVCTAEMEEALISHLREGAFLGEFGITSISKEDSIHYEVLDTDWSGGGAYTGDGPELALIMYERNKPELAWDILRRHFWMGKHFIYYPQEHFTDKPMAPAHKRANDNAGLAGAEAILFGLAGFQPRYNGQLFINPRLVCKGNIRIAGFRFRNNAFDVELSTEKMKVIRNGSVLYEGKPEMIRIL